MSSQLAGQTSDVSGDQAWLCGPQSCESAWWGDDEKEEKKKAPDAWMIMDVCTWNILKLLQTPNMRHCIILYYLCGSEYVSIKSSQSIQVVFGAAFLRGAQSKWPVVYSKVTSQGFKTGSIHLKIIQRLLNIKVDLRYDTQLFPLYPLFPWYPHSSTRIQWDLACQESEGGVDELVRTSTGWNSTDESSWNLSTKILVNSGQFSVKFESGWWFGCHHFYFPTYWESSSQLTFIFFRGVQTTNQECSIELTPGMIQWSYELMIPVHYRPLGDHDMRGRVREEKNQQPSQDRAVRVQKSWVGK